MNLLCPNCQKMLQVPEQYAGQLMKCPLCTGTFTVPALPQSPAPPPPPPQFTPPQNVPPPPHDMGMGGAPAPEPGAAPSLPPAGYTHQRSYTISSRAMSWIAPIGLIVIFVLMFFPWAGMYPAGVGVVTQTGWNVAFGGYDSRANKVWDKNYGASETDKITEKVGVAMFLIFYLLVLFPAIIIALGTTLIHNRLVPVELPPSLQQYWSFRPLLVAVLCLAGLVFLALQLMGNLPLERATMDEAEAKVKKDKPDRPTDDDEMKAKLDAGRLAGQYNLERTGWLTLVVVLQVLALFGALLDYWAERRGPRRHHQESTY